MNRTVDKKVMLLLIAQEWIIVLQATSLSLQHGVRLISQVYSASALCAINVEEMTFIE